jgi:hypothetical protein
MKNDVVNEACRTRRIEEKRRREKKLRINEKWCCSKLVELGE